MLSVKNQLAMPSLVPCCRQLDNPEEVLVVGAAALDDLRMSLAAAKEGRRNLANENDKLTSQIAGLQQQLDAASSSVAASQGVTAADREAMRQLWLNVMPMIQSAF